MDRTTSLVLLVLETSMVVAVLRKNLILAITSALVGALAIGVAFNDGRPISLEGFLGIVLIGNALVRYLIARQH